MKSFLGFVLIFSGLIVTTNAVGSILGVHFFLFAGEFPMNLIYSVLQLLGAFAIFQTATRWMQSK